jgi:hypothetical protein
MKSVRNEHQRDRNERAIWAKKKASKQRENIGDHKRLEKQKTHRSQ